MHANDPIPIRTPAQGSLFIDDFPDAIRHLAHQCGGLKQFAAILRPDLADEPDKAHRWLLDCLNTDRHHELHIAHLIRAGRVGRDIGCHVVAAFLMEKMNYQPPVPATPKSEETKLSEEIAALWSEASRKQRELDRLKERQT